MKTKSLYGFSSELAPFAGKTPAEQVVLLQSWGNTAIFGGYRDREFVEAVHAAGMSIFAEFSCFVGKQWWEELPESRPVTATGTLLDPDGWYYGVNPTVPEVRQERLLALETLLTDYDIDGVWLDFIRWPCHWEVREPVLPRTSFDPGTVAMFCRDTGCRVAANDAVRAAEALLEEHEAAWAAWRCEQITSWVAEARAAIDRLRPGALLGLFGVPWRRGDYDGAILKVIGQDYSALGHYVDVFSPMVYHTMCGYPVEWIGAVTREVYALSGKPVWPIVQAVDEPVPLSAREYGRALDIVLGDPEAGGVLVFTLKAALEREKLAITKARFCPDK
ncbi:MAG: hypothetical protein JXA89_02805 [Anaerolineae bacterium]|nr:hypothetical protein [Anaerolineae bacterium]